MKRNGPTRGPADKNACHQNPQGRRKKTDSQKNNLCRGTMARMYSTHIQNKPNTYNLKKKDRTKEVAQQLSTY